MRAAIAFPLLCLFALLLPLGSQAEMYSWKDANGKVHYGDRPPATQQARKVPGAPAETSDVEAVRKTAAERKFNEREKQARPQDAEKKPAEDPAQARIRAENCQRARAQLSALETGEIRFMVNERGERVVLDGAQRDAELKRARKSVADWCSPPSRE